MTVSVTASNDEVTGHHRLVSGPTQSNEQMDWYDLDWKTANPVWVVTVTVAIAKLAVPRPQSLRREPQAVRCSASSSFITFRHGIHPYAIIDVTRRKLTGRLLKYSTNLL